MFKFIWKNKTHYLRKSQLVRDYENGGLRAMDFESVIAAFRIKWLKDCSSHPLSIWYHIPNKIFNKVGGLEFLFECDFEVSRIPVKLSNGNIMFTHNFSPHNFNRVITICRKINFQS